MTPRALTQLNLIKNELAVEPLNYLQAKKQAEVIDQLLGYNIHRIEAGLVQKKNDIQNKGESDKDPKNFWFQLEPQSLLTPYSELLKMVLHLKSKASESWIDLGSGYGRMGIIISLFTTDINFIGIEAVSERSDEANRIYENFHLKRAKSVPGDVFEQKAIWAEADVFFLYDFGSTADIHLALDHLKEISLTKKIKVIARGRNMRQIILNQNPWLYCNFEPEHFENWSVFKS